jgi:nucleotide-binding universal stress UspA family protein
MSSASTDTEPIRPSSTEVGGRRRRRRVKVVGYDGSDNGRNVVAGAASRVGPGDRLIIVHALEAPYEGADPASRYDQICQQMISDLDAAVLDAIDHELRVVQGSPAQVLIDVALHTNATEIIVGTRRAPSRLGQRTIRSQLEAGPVPVVALLRAERKSHPLAERIDSSYRHGYESFPASDPPSTWAGPANTRRDRTAAELRS